ncbi:MAG: hypothetical protein J6S67_21260 [Methanobrevibacter sp.]|nr:hypothetical protein [Methanobrevibacter sp.]
MTTYNYMSEMQEMCFRATQALIVLGDKGMQDFYAAAEQGFYNRANGLSVEEANAPINVSQIDSYLATKDFVESKEYEAALKLKKEQEAADGRN